MARLTASDRAKLPDSAFAYVDARGRRLLPINDEAHVRNALARFEQVRFEDDEARERARKRLLNAAKRFGIVPVGFITGQIERAQTPAAATLPEGFITLLMTDIEGSTTLVRRLGDRWGGVLDAVRGIQRRILHKAGGREVDARADELFAVFEGAGPALEAAVQIHRQLAAHPWPDGVEVRVRAGLHSGRPTRAGSGYIGLPVHTTARLCALAKGGQTVVSDSVRAAVQRSSHKGVGFRDLGQHSLRGLPEPQALFEVDPAETPP